MDLCLFKNIPPSITFRRLASHAPSIYVARSTDFFHPLAPVRVELLRFRPEA